MRNLSVLRSSNFVRSKSVTESVDLLLITNVVLISVVFTVGFGGLLLYFRRNRSQQYDEVLHRVQLEKLRESLEARVYDINDRLMSTEERWQDVNHLQASRLKTQSDIVEENNSELTKFLKSYGLTKTDMEVDPKLVFVLVPFNARFKRTYAAIVDACTRVGLKCVRGDEDQVRGDLMPHILRLIGRAKIIIAVVDGRNPNVFYELGIAHALNKVTILITKSIESAPFDLQSKKLIAYSQNSELTEKLQSEIVRSLLIEE